MSDLVNIVGLALLGGVLGLVGGVTLLMVKSWSRILAEYAVPFAAGVLLTVSLLGIIPEAVEVIGESYEQCVETYKRLSGRNRSLGYAGNIPSQGDVPAVGAGALWRNYGHIGYVTAVNGDTVIVVDSNWVKGKLTRHTLSVDNFRGFIYN